MCRDPSNEVTLATMATCGSERVSGFDRLGGLQTHTVGQRIPVRDRLGPRVSVFDRLGGPQTHTMGHRIPVKDRLGPRVPNNQERRSRCGRSNEGQFNAQADETEASKPTMLTHKELGFHQTAPRQEAFQQHDKRSQFRKQNGEVDRHQRHHREPEPENIGTLAENVKPRVNPRTAVLMAPPPMNAGPHRQTEEPTTTTSNSDVDESNENSNCDMMDWEPQEATVVLPTWNPQMAICAQ